MAVFGPGISLRAEFKDFNSALITLLDFSRRAPNRLSVIMRDEAVSIIVPEIKQKLKDNESIFTAKLQKNIRVRRGFTGDSAHIDIIADADYAVNVERGAPPHTPDLKKLVEYARKKSQSHLRPVIFGKTVITRKKTKREIKVFNSKKVGISRGRLGAYTAAIRIYNTIKREGSKPHPFFVDTIQDHLPGFFYRVLSTARIDLLTDVR